MIKPLSPLLLLASVAASAQTVPPPMSDQDIVVTGTRPADRKEIERFVADISERRDGQLARFHQPICPVVIGLQKPYGAIVEQHIRANAALVGARVDKAKCPPNLIVVFATDGAALVKDIRRKRPGWLEGLDGSDIEALERPGQTRAWSVTSLRNEDGKALYTPPPGSGSVGDPLGDKPVLSVMSASIIGRAFRQDMEASFVVIDEAATYGLTLRQLAGYVAMRTLAGTRPPAGRASVNSILTLFDGAASHPAGLSDVDAGYLRALYASPGTNDAIMERSAITRRIAKGK